MVNRKETERKGEERRDNIIERDNYTGSKVQIVNNLYISMIITILSIKLRLNLPNGLLT